MRNQMQQYPNIFYLTPRFQVQATYTVAVLLARATASAICYKNNQLFDSELRLALRNKTQQTVSTQP